MIVYADLISGDQVLSDSRPQKPLTFEGEVIPGVITVQAKLSAKGPVEVNSLFCSFEPGVGERGGEEAMYLW